MSQITERFISDNAVTGAKLRLKNSEVLRGRNAAGDGDISILRVTASDRVEFQKLPYVESGLPIPSDPKQLATIEFIENYLAGKTTVKDAVHALAVTNVALTGSAPLTIDGFGFTASAVPQRIALVEQTTASQNGVYDYSESGGTYTLTRSSDFDQVADAGGKEVRAGTYFKVINGDAFSGYEVQLITADPIVIGTTALLFARYPSSLALSAGDMMERQGNLFAVALATDSGLESTDPGNVGGQLRVKVDGQLTEPLQTTRINPNDGTLIARTGAKYRTTLTATNITNGYIDLPDVAGFDSVHFAVAGAPNQLEGVDYTVNYTGGTSSKTRITFAGGLAAAGASALIEGDVVAVTYTRFNIAV